VNFDGSIKIVGGPTIRINDPNGVFGAPYTLLPEFTADDENPSVTAFSGFRKYDTGASNRFTIDVEIAMCVPRSAADTLCPATNRPAGQNTL
jgi:hypothetical protein